MTAEQFNNFWDRTYPGTPPIQHLFKYAYADRWFRIHSLPRSKRYADTKEEWDILLTRQNEIITDILGQGKKVLLVTGDHTFEASGEGHVTQLEPVFSSFSFTRAGDVDLHKLAPEEYEERFVYRPAFTEVVWGPNRYDDLLSAIADDQLGAFFISPESGSIVAPYDGGIDLILKDTATRDRFNEKYKEWLSEQEDGL